MAKQSEKIVIKSINLFSLLIAVVLFALAIYGNTILNAADNNIFGYNAAFLTNPDNITAMFSDAESIEIKGVFALIGIAIVSVVSLIISIKLIFLFFGLFGFLGKKDSAVVARKLSKFAKNALGTLALEIFGLIVFAIDDGIFTESASSLFVIVGIVFAVLYLLVRYYRWFVSAERPLLDCLFEFLKDLIYIFAIVILLSLFDVAIFENVLKIQTYFGVEANNGILYDKTVKAIISCITPVFEFFILTSLMRKTLRLMPFNNYKRDAYSKLRAGYITLFVFVVLFAIVDAIMVNIISGSFDGINYVSLVINIILSVLPTLFVMVAVCVASLIDNEKRPEFAYPIKKLQALEEQAQLEESDATETEVSDEEAVEEQE